MENFQNWLQSLLHNNSFREYSNAAITAVIIFAACLILKKLSALYLKKFAAKTISDIDDFIAQLISKIHSLVFLALALFIATLPLALDSNVDKVIRRTFVIILTFQAVFLLQEVAKYGVQKGYKRARPSDPAGDVIIRNVNIALSWTIWALGIIFILDNLGINVTALMAGLGIGGVAIAMASQAVLKDGLGALSIFIDKPFEVGDFIQVGDLLGAVEYVGLKTTRIRSLSGEQIIFSNSDLTDSRVRNFKRMETRRIQFRLGVVYQTPIEKLKAIPEYIKQICMKVDGVKLDRAHFQGFGDSALTFEIVYFVMSPDYNLYMDKQQRINLEIKDLFDREGIEFAYPTQTLYVPETFTKSK